MENTVVVDKFETPSGNVAGIAAVTVTRPNGKKVRVAHATLLTDAPADLTLKLPTAVSPAEIPGLLNGLSEMASILASEAHDDSLLAQIDAELALANAALARARRLRMLAQARKLLSSEAEADLAAEFNDPVGVADRMPGTGGHNTMAVFVGSQVPPGTPVYTAAHLPVVLARDRKSVV